MAARMLIERMKSFSSSLYYNNEKFDRYEILDHLTEV
jgi:hypothetical protein